MQALGTVISDVVDRQVLVMIARWCSKQPLTNHMQCFATQRILEIIARKLVLIPLTICWD